MTRFFIIVLLTFLTAIGSAQTTKVYLEDLNNLYTVLKNTPSFKDQMKGAKLKEYNNLYASLKKDTVNVSTNHDVFNNLTKLFFPLRDNHLGFYEISFPFLDKSSFTDSVAIKQYRGSKAFQDYPKFNINLDSLELELTKRPKDSIEGIYYYDTYLKIGLFRTSRKNQYVGIVLATTLPNWEKGQIAIRLYGDTPNNFKAIYAHPVFKGLMLYNNEKFRNQSLINSYFYSSISESIYKKNINEPDFVNIKKKELKFQFKKINSTTQYMRLGSFSASTAAMKVSQGFYDQIKDSLTTPNLVLDLRDNTGGAYKVSKKFLKLIKAYSKKGNVYLVINNGTMSQGEMFTLQLKKLSNIKTFGQTTMGTIAYGSNFGKTVELPSERFKIYITDMKDSGNYLPYESFGVAPDVILKNDSDWIEQIVRRIERK